jgi:hypothetical protein
MTFSKNSLPSTSTPNLGELLRRQISASDNAEERDPLSSSGLLSFTAATEQLRMQRQLQQESRSSVQGNEESDSISSSSGLRSFTAVTEQLRMQRHLQQESGSSAQGNEESNNIASSSDLHSFTAAPRDSHPRTSRARSLDTLRSILHRAIAVLDDDELEDSVISSRRDDLHRPQ